jgi:hypothetical protein
MPPRSWEHVQRATFRPTGRSAASKREGSRFEEGGFAVEEKGRRFREKGRCGERTVLEAAELLLGRRSRRPIRGVERTHAGPRSGEHVQRATFRPTGRSAASKREGSRFEEGGFAVEEKGRRFREKGEVRRADLPAESAASKRPSSCSAGDLAGRSAGSSAPMPGRVRGSTFNARPFRPTGRSAASKREGSRLRRREGGLGRRGRWRRAGSPRSGRAPARPAMSPARSAGSSAACRAAFVGARSTRGLSGRPGGRPLRRGRVRGSGEGKALFPGDAPQAPGAGKNTIWAGLVSTSPGPRCQNAWRGREGPRGHRGVGGDRAPVP